MRGSTTYVNATDKETDTIGSVSVTLGVQLGL